MEKKSGNRRVKEKKMALYCNIYPIKQLITQKDIS